MTYEVHNVYGNVIARMDTQGYVETASGISRGQIKLNEERTRWVAYDSFMTYRGRMEKNGDVYDACGNLLKSKASWQAAIILLLINTAC